MLNNSTSCLNNNRLENNNKIITNNNIKICKIRPIDRYKLKFVYIYFDTLLKLIFFLFRYIH